MSAITAPLTKISGYAFEAESVSNRVANSTDAGQAAFSPKGYFNENNVWVSGGGAPATSAYADYDGGDDPMPDHGSAPSDLATRQALPARLADPAATQPFGTSTIGLNAFASNTALGYTDADYADSLEDIYDADGIPLTMRPLETPSLVDAMTFVGQFESEHPLVRAEFEP